MVRSGFPSHLLITGLVCLSAAVAACGGQQAKPAGEAQAQSQPAKNEAKRYHLEGKVVAVKADANALSIDAKDIPGFMTAMTMDYSVKSAQSLTGLNTGDDITADVVVPAEGPPYIENIKVTKKAGA